MYFIFLCSILYSFGIASGQLALEDDTFELESDLTPHTFFELSNGSKEYKPFNLTEFEMASRRQLRRPELKHVGTQDHIARACYYLATTYKSALSDIRKYFPLRYLYYNTLDYEVGYVTHEIIARYQTILELYHLIQRRFEKIPERHTSPASYMFYIYMNILEQSKVILHLCNMLHELPRKYRKRPKSIFHDVNAIDHDNADAVAAALQHQAYEKRLHRERKERARERRKQFRQNLAIANLKIPVFTKQPKKSAWPRDYGWSVELWWKEGQE